MENRNGELKNVDVFFKKLVFNVRGLDDFLITGFINGK